LELLKQAFEESETYLTNRRAYTEECAHKVRKNVDQIRIN